MANRLQGKVAIVTGGAAGIDQSDEASFITGTHLMVDGGYIAQVV